MGMGDSRGRWTFVRRSVVAAMSATLTVLVASRVNRPVEPGAPLSWQPGVMDEVLPDVRMDATSLSHLIDSINTAAVRPRVRLDATGLRVNPLTLRTGDARPAHWRNARIGDVLAMAARGAFHDGTIEWREQGGTIVVGCPGPLECRCA